MSISQTALSVFGALLANEFFESRDILTGIALSDADGRERSAIGLTDIEDVHGAEAEDSGFFLGRARVRRLNFPNEWGENHQALFALLDEVVQ